MHTKTPITNIQTNKDRCNPQITQQTDKQKCKINMQTKTPITNIQTDKDRCNPQITQQTDRQTNVDVIK